ncbi:aminodeoxychorismate/anthranilate synthase component II [Mollicutes bacterium LVI A0039]|nr:aminodeoxychorismate/anthranilate synthase component II [Mollicutes bacterium LVI A0039]
MILMIDNYDSFTYNLVRYFEQLNEQVLTVQNDQITIAEIEAINPAAIVLSPGPKRPEDAKICLEVVKTFANVIPIFGVCLGHQVIGLINGASVIKAPIPIHGKEDFVYLNGRNRLVEGIPDTFKVTRYHSLHVVANDNIEVIGQTNDGIVMISKVKDQCVYSVQYHPESFLTEYGTEILANFLKIAKEFNDREN